MCIDITLYFVYYIVIKRKHPPHERTVQIMIIGTLENGKHCAYDLPNNIKTAEQFNSLIDGYNYNPRQREELQGQPTLIGLNGPMFNGFGTLKSTGETVAIIRYEIPTKY